jgi:hypothetical protein
VSTVMATYPPPATPSLATLRARILTDDRLPARRRGDLASALRVVAKAIGKPLEAIPAEPASIRPLLQGVTAAQRGHRPGRWRNIRSLVAAALACPRSGAGQG